RVERVVGRERGGEVDRAHVEAAVEALGVAVPAGVVAGAADHRDVPAFAGQSQAERAQDVRRSPTREEDRGGDDPARHRVSMLRDGYRLRNTSAVLTARPPGRTTPCSSRGTLHSAPPKTSDVEPPPSRLSARSAPSAASA